MRRFYVGLHQPSDAWRFKRCCVSIRRLKGRKKPLGCPDVLVDSGAFTELNLYGEYRTSVWDYAVELCRLWKKGVVNITAAVTQDYMCEEFMLAKTGLSVAEHQRLTIERYDELSHHLNWLFRGKVPFHVLPVLQGYTLEEYVSHIRQYGERLKLGMWCGVGSVCKRNASPESIVAVLGAIKWERGDLQLHGFGIKQTAFTHPIVVQFLESSDSMAWSFRARIEGRDGNSPYEAKDFADGIEKMCGLNQNNA